MNIFFVDEHTSLLSVQVPQLHQTFRTESKRSDSVLPVGSTPDTDPTCSADNATLQYDRHLLLYQSTISCLNLDFLKKELIICTQIPDGSQCRSLGQTRTTSDPYRYRQHSASEHIPQF